MLSIGRTLVLSALVALLCSTAVFAGQEAQQADAKGKTTLHGLVAAGAEAVYDGTRAGLSAACDGSRAGMNGAYDGANWAVHQTPADYGKMAWRGGGVTLKQTAKTPGRLYRGFKWGISRL